MGFVNIAVRKRIIGRTRSVAGRLCVCLTIIAASTAHAQTGAAERGLVRWTERTFGNVTVLCNARRTCYAFARSSSSTGFNERVYLELTRTGERDAVPTIRVGFEGSALEPGRDLRTESVLDITGDGATSVSLSREHTAGEGSYVATGDTLALATRLARATRAELEDERGVTVSLDGSSAAMRFIDEVQRRIGTTTALVARGRAPSSGIPSVPAWPAVRRGVAVPQDDLTAAPAVVREAVERCESEDVVGPSSGSYTEDRLSRDTVLFTVSCIGYRWAESDVLIMDREGHVSEHVLDWYPSDHGGHLEYDYDPDQRTLTAVSLDVYATHATWVFTGARFVLVRLTIEGSGRHIVVFEARIVARAIGSSVVAAVG